MGNVWIPGGGGAGSGSDECTATKAEVLKGYSAITSDSDDEVVEGTLELTGDSSDSHVLVGKTYYNTDPKKKRTGTMSNQGAINQTLNAGGSYTIPAGYHNGAGKITANSLASQTSGNADSTKIVSGYSAYVNGNKVNGTLNVQSILSFSCAPYSASQIIFTWQNPHKGPFSGVIIVGKTGGYPANINDGIRYYKGFGNNANASGVSNSVISGFGINITYYFRAFSYSTINGEEWTSGTTLIGNTIIQKVTSIFTSSSTWTIPSNVNSIDIFCVGGGAGGDDGETADSTYASWGGNGGQTTNVYNVSVTPNSQLQIIIGSGGRHSGSGQAGGTTTVSCNNQILCSAIGGKNYSVKGVGYTGSGGGAGVRVNSGNRRWSKGGNGGTDGSKGGDNEGYKEGEARGRVGQSRTTKPFEDPNGTPYSGGGGGGGNGGEGGNEEFPGEGGYYGGGGGAMLGLRNAINGTPNSGSGGGGGATGHGYKSNSVHNGADGGSGICIIKYVG